MQSKHQQKVNDRLAQNLKAGKENVKNALPGLKKTRKALNLFEKNLIFPPKMCMLSFPEIKPSMHQRKKEKADIPDYRYKTFRKNNSIGWSNGVF